MDVLFAQVKQLKQGLSKLLKRKIAPIQNGLVKLLIAVFTGFVAK